MKGHRGQRFFQSILPVAGQRGSITADRAASRKGPYEMVKFRRNRPQDNIPAHQIDRRIPGHNSANS